MSQNNILSISSLKSRRPKEWKIVAKVKYLSKKKEGPTGNYFYVDLIDTTGEEIRAMAYNSEAYRLYQQLEVNSVYSIKNGKIQEENKKFTRGNDFEIIFNEHTVIIKQEIDNNAPNLGKLVSKKDDDDEEDASVVKTSQSQNNALLEDRSQNSIAKEEVLKIDERLKVIKKKELLLAIEKLELEYDKLCL